MLRKLRNRHRQARKGPMDMNRDRFELDLTLEEVIADLNYGAGTDAETDRLVPASRREAGIVQPARSPRRMLDRPAELIDLDLARVADKPWLTSLWPIQGRHGH